MKRILVMIVIIIAIAASAFLLLPKDKTTNQTPVTNQNITPTTVILPSIDVSVPENWVPFTSQQYGFSIQYPLDMTHQTTSEGERFYKLGDTQSTGTELYDGISVMIKSGDLGGQTLADFVRNKHTETKKDQLQPEVGEIKQVSIAGLAGFSFRVRSIGDGTFIYLPKGNNEYLEIVNGTVEPAQREQTFQKIVDQMLSTLKID